MKRIQIYFSDFFEIDESIIDSYGAINVSLINDMPLFLDPFLLFNSSKKKYKEIHKKIIDYFVFLKSQAEKYPNAEPGMIKSWYLFPEVKQTWIGFSLKGNSGRGLGKDFAVNLHKGLQTIFKDFGTETITSSSHLEKLCLISDFVGRDKISDLTTNFAKKLLLDYTSSFAKKYIDDKYCRTFCINKCEFNYDTMSWKNGSYILPCYNNDFVLLTPRDMLTRSETFINRKDMIRNINQIEPSVTDDALRFKLNNYLSAILSSKREKVNQSDKDSAALSFIEKNPDFIDYYIKHKEENKEMATNISKKVVSEVEQLFNRQVQVLVNILDKQTDFYKSVKRSVLNSYDEAYNRAIYLKKVIEDYDGYRIFYIQNKPIRRESDLQIMYRLIWFASDMDVNREVNNGRGPVDYKVSKGSADMTLVEFKLASNTKLKQNLKNQVEVYKKANQTKQAIKVILYFSEKEYKKVNKILDELDIKNNKDFILINAINHKTSASNVI